MAETESLSLSRKTTVVVGATGTIGRTASDLLAKRGHAVRGVARSLGISLTDRSGLESAFAGAHGAYVMIPFDMGAPDLHESERTVSSALADAISRSGLRRVVLLSGLNAHLRLGTSLGAAEMEERLATLDLPELVCLRAGFFNENFIGGMSFLEQADSGVFATPFRGDRAMPLIAAQDIGTKVAELLDAETIPRASVVELQGGGRHTFSDATAIMARVLGKVVQYRTVPLDEARSAMIDGGMSLSFADALIETAASFNRGDRWALEAPSAGNTTPTTFEAWARKALSIPSAV